MRETFLVLSLFVWFLHCDREYNNPLDPLNPNSNAEYLPAPTGLKATAGYTWVELIWDSMPGAVKYQVYREGNKIAEPDTIYYKDTGLEGGGTYMYQVAAVHPSGLGGEKSEPVSATTRSGPYIKFSRYEIYSDDNGDGIVNKGEAIGLNVYLKNTGTSIAQDVKATLSTSGSYISISDNEWSYSGENIPPGEEKKGSGYSNFTFKVSKSCPENHTITFYLAIKDEANNTWSDTFQITVSPTGAKIKFSRYEIYSDDNGDGIVNKGETIGLNVYLKNTGTSIAQDVKATLSTSGSYISISDNEWSYSGENIPPGGEKKGSGYSNFTFKVSKSCPSGHTITFNLDINDKHSNSWQDSFKITVH